MDPRAAHLIAELQLAPHPEGGHFRRIHESAVTIELDGRSRPALTAIHFLLARGEVSQWHRVDADESWHWQEGGALELRVFDPVAGVLASTVLDRSGQGAPMHVVPAGHWQAALPLGEYALVACTVSPGFVWEGFELLAGHSEVAAVLSRMGSYHLG
ncbi:cupin domain-containing protein [Lysobacter sp. S4-A87]|uniref:cupin domain-containing protein n=1 Tax=Lysobacter sp. S4-A87 TaxID=2925843 RepID=UPI001F53D459|nr:cupin domain-containing protein [Lysobacter sp. S4-A87]UNK50579.1 cupin domain-containing protein [Lysobacter sp. S4-A87]